MLKQLITLYIILIIPIYLQSSPVPIEKVPQWVVNKQVEIPTQVPIKDINNGIYTLILDKQIRVDKDKKTAFYSHYSEMIVNQKGLDEIS